MPAPREPSRNSTRPMQRTVADFTASLEETRVSLRERIQQLTSVIQTDSTSEKAAQFGRAIVLKWKVIVDSMLVKFEGLIARFPRRARSSPVWMLNKELASSWDRIAAKLNEADGEFGKLRRMLAGDSQAHRRPQAPQPLTPNSARRPIPTARMNLPRDPERLLRVPSSPAEFTPLLEQARNSVSERIRRIKAVLETGPVCERANRLGSSIVAKWQAILDRLLVKFEASIDKCTRRARRYPMWELINELTALWDLIAVELSTVDAELPKLQNIFREARIARSIRGPAARSPYSPRQLVLMAGTRSPHVDRDKKAEEDARRREAIDSWKHRHGDQA